MGVRLRVDGQQVISFHSRFLCWIEIQFRETRATDEDSYVYLVVPVFGICNNMSIMMLSMHIKCPPFGVVAGTLCEKT